MAVAQRLPSVATCWCPHYMIGVQCNTIARFGGSDWYRHVLTAVPSARIRQMAEHGLSSISAECLRGAAPKIPFSIGDKFRTIMRRTVLHVRDILAWADAHRRRKGKWPHGKAGRVIDVPDEKWANIDQALRKGLRGLPGKSSLPQLLAEHRGHRNRKRLPKYTIAKVVSWADAHHQRTGRWPSFSSGSIVDAPGETWLAVDMALRHGQRGLRGGSSLAILLSRRRRVRHRLYVPDLSVKKILAWADAHRRRTGEWPMAESGSIARSGGETWMAIDQAKAGSRGLRTRSSLFKLLLKHRGVRRHVRRGKRAVAQG